MKGREPGILFVSHEASRSGAPLILLGIIKEFRKQSAIPFYILIMEDGPLTSEFKLLGETYVWRKKQPAYLPSFLRKIISLFYRLSLYIRGPYILFKLKKIPLVFLNTISNGHIHKKLALFNPIFICYVHEMNYTINIVTNQSVLKFTLKNTHLFLAGSTAVKNNLIKTHGVPAEKIEVHYSSLEITSREKTSYSAAIRSFKASNAIPENAIVIGVASSGEWRKGLDLFFPLIAMYFSLHPGSNVFFIWKGYKSVGNSTFYEMYDLNQLGYANQVALIPHGGGSIECIAAYDIHLLLSREDPYPLVVLEAASFGVPTICFENAGGTVEFVENDCGYRCRM
ncbi:MAG: glycosyltransferase [Chitinophagaceae bacterium]